MHQRHVGAIPESSHKYKTFQLKFLLCCKPIKSERNAVFYMLSCCHLFLSAIAIPFLLKQSISATLQTDFLPLLLSTIMFSKEK